MDCQHMLAKRLLNDSLFHKVAYFLSCWDWIVSSKKTLQNTQALCFKLMLIVAIQQNVDCQTATNNFPFGISKKLRHWT